MKNSTAKPRASVWRATCFALALAAAKMANAHADDWPQKTILVVVPYPAGGAVDVIMRAVGAHMTQTLGQSVLIQNRPGASSDLGAAAVARAAPDGYTLLASGQWLTLNPMIETNIPWRESDLAPVARFAKSPNYLAVSYDAPARTLKDYVQFARSKPGQFYGSTGVGSTQELVMDALISSTGIRLVPVLYKGAPPIVVDMIGGRLSIAAMAAANVTAPVKGHQLRLLASSADARSAQQPNVPTLTELGYSKVDMSSWYGVHAPAKTPPSVIKKIEHSVRDAMSDPKVLRQLALLDSQPAFFDAAAFTRFLDQERVRWAPVMKAETRSP
jgi:tripartite-type tricarboxylate transporter receptor subunit TctC